MTGHFDQGYRSPNLRIDQVQCDRGCEAKTIRLSFALKAGIEDIEETFENG